MQLLICKKCSKRITIGSKTGLCRSCANKIVIKKRMANATQCDCGRKIAPYNKTGHCCHCNAGKSIKSTNLIYKSYRRIKAKNGNGNGDGNNKVIGMARCQFQYCGKEFTKTVGNRYFCSESCQNRAMESDDGWAYKNGYIEKYPRQRRVSNVQE